MTTTRKTPDQIAAMRRAGMVVASTLAVVKQAIAPGITTAELDALAAQHIAAVGATPSFLGYHGYPATICVSVNEEVVHGIPGPRVINEGDIVSVDCGAILEGWHGDAAFTVAVGEVPTEIAQLLTVTEGALHAGAAAALPGNRVSDISAAIADYVHRHGEYGILQGYTGHGIGRSMHEAPEIPNEPLHRWGLASPKLKVGMTIAIEPMLTLGSSTGEELDDEWTVVTDDGSWSAHCEHTIAITNNGPQILTTVADDPLLG